MRDRQTGKERQMQIKEHVGTAWELVDQTKTHASNNSKVIICGNSYK